MTEELVAVVERQFRFLLRQEGLQVSRELRRTLDVLRREPRIALLLSDARREAVVNLERFDAAEARTVEQLQTVRVEFAARLPQYDDSGEPRPADLGMGDAPWLRTLAAFDAIASGEPLTVVYSPRKDRGVAASLISILQSKFERARRFDPTTQEYDYGSRDNHPEIDDLQQRMSAIRTAHIRTWRAFFDAVLTEPGSALLYLEHCIEWLSSPAIGPMPDKPTQRILTALSLSTPFLEETLYEGARLDEKQSEAVERFNRDAKSAARRLHYGLLLRLGTTRSLLAVFQRFQTRCEWHDRERLLALVEGSRERAAKRGGRPQRTKAEQRLTEELARYLFDQGLNPLSEVPAGVHRADLLEPDRLYVEAKQYAKGNPTAYLLRGTRQVFEMMARLQASDYRLTEAFYVVFRRGGLRVAMPDEVRFPNFTLRPILVDLTPSSASGSRAQPRVDLSAEQILASAEATAVGARAARRSRGSPTSRRTPRRPL